MKPKFTLGPEGECVCMTGEPYGPHSLPSDLVLDQGGGAIYPCMAHLRFYFKADAWKIVGFKVDGSQELWYQIYEKERFAMSGVWVKQWDVVGSTGNVYVVSQKNDGTFACACPGWKFKKAPKPDCRHIKGIKQKLRWDNGRNVAEATPRKLATVNPFRRPEAESPRCGQCGVVFISQRALILHQSIHAAEQQLIQMGEVVVPQSSAVDGRVEVEGETFLIRGRKFRE